MTSTSARVLSDSLDKLHINRDPRRTTPKKQTTTAESWEDEADNDDRALRSAVEPLSSPLSELPGAPPTSPASPSVRTRSTSIGSPFQTFPPFGMNGTPEAEQVGASRFGSVASDRRPEKTTSVASRLIAAGVGQKAPKRTQEQREYDQAMKVQEKKRRDAAEDEALKAKQAEENAKRAIWED